MHEPEVDKEISFLVPLITRREDDSIKQMVYK